MLYYYYNIVQMATQNMSPEPAPGPSWRQANYTRGRVRGRPPAIMCHNCRAFGHKRYNCPNNCKYPDN